jgi:hypothetical protein
MSYLELFTVFSYLQNLKKYIFLPPYSSNITIPPQFTLSHSRLYIATHVKFYSTLLYKSTFFSCTNRRRLSTFHSFNVTKPLQMSKQNKWILNFGRKTQGENLPKDADNDRIILKRNVQKCDAKRIHITLPQDSDSLNRVNTDRTAVLRLQEGEREQTCTTLNQAMVPNQPINMVSSILDSSAIRTRICNSQSFSAKVMSQKNTSRPTMITNIWNIYHEKGKARPRQALVFPGDWDFQISKQHMKVDRSHLTGKGYI